MWKQICSTVDMTRKACEELLDINLGACEKSSCLHSSYFCYADSISAVSIMYFP